MTIPMVSYPTFAFSLRSLATHGACSLSDLNRTEVEWSQVTLIDPILLSSYLPSPIKLLACLQASSSDSSLFLGCGGGEERSFTDLQIDR